MYDAPDAPFSTGNRARSPTDTWYEHGLACVTKRLAALEEAGLVFSKRVSHENRYLVHPSGLIKASRYLERASKRTVAALELSAEASPS